MCSSCWTLVPVRNPKACGITANVTLGQIQSGPKSPSQCSANPTRFRQDGWAAPPVSSSAVNVTTVQALRGNEITPPDHFPKWDMNAALFRNHTLISEAAGAATLILVSEAQLQQQPSPIEAFSCGPTPDAEWLQWNHPHTADPADPISLTGSRRQEQKPSHSQDGTGSIRGHRRLQ